MNPFSISSLNEIEVLCFFMILMRMSVLFSVVPIVGDRVVPAPVKILLSLAVSLVIFPTLLRTGKLNLENASLWSRDLSQLLWVLVSEIFLALLMGFVARILFDAISFGANLVGTYMGFASASTYDPHQESQSQVIAQLQTTLAMIIFLAVDGHHLMLQAALESYQWVGLGQASFTPEAAQTLISFTGQTLVMGLQLSAPVAFTIFTVNVIFGVLSKAMPQLNVLVLSFAITAGVGLVVMLLSVPEFQGVSSAILGRVGDWTQEIAVASRSQ